MFLIILKIAYMQPQKRHPQTQRRRQVKGAAVPPDKTVMRIRQIGKDMKMIASTTMNTAIMQTMPSTRIQGQQMMQRKMIRPIALSVAVVQVFLEWQEYFSPLAARPEASCAQVR